ncbi:WD40 repeat-containing protein SMU1-like protein [Gamsiella multidivaricata]|uniref:WD40 repeat-containing protein SMU1-like protein n=1 Tax=Gamsiella multidivaricata TaxID=101098 RepID=UPI00221FB4B6|nr:WD40 repeat-containing protein SMU1-like protein [Gamsiella multidivaricata]KAG0363928.1 Serine/threonine-protein kinase smu1 [Gamsiella multidivaricata]KAI7820379.1 WD40 repeat-containing protein SMU1-like protein [Gamsiella multidivaricata]
MSSSTTNTMEIESNDVIRLIQQFLKENNLLNSLAALQEETTVALNTVESVEAFSSEILQGHWDNVLRIVSQLKIPDKKLMDLYEQIVIELVEMREIGTARTLLRQTTPTQMLREQFPDRYLHLEHVLSRSHFDAKEAYPNGVSKEKRRQIIAQALSSEVTVVAPSRLVTLLGQALKFQEQQGMLPPDSAYDLFRGTVPVAQAETDDVPTKCYNTIKFPKKQHAECVAFSPNGQYLVTGSMDGFIEIWNYLTAKLRKDLKYQAEDNLMAMESAVLCLGFSRDSEMLASGAQDGRIKVWKIQTGQCLRRYSPAHQAGVTSVCFSPDGTQVLSASFDLTVRLHGLKSGKMLKEFRGHTSFVNHASFSLDGTQVMSSSSDGTIKIWDYRTANCLKSFSPHDGTGTMAGVAGLTVNSCVPFPKPNQILVCMKSPTAYLLTMEGEPIRKFTSPDSQTEGATKDLTAAAAERAAGGENAKKEGLGVPMTDFMALSLSPQSEIVYCLAENSQVHCYYSDSGKLIKSIPVAEGEVIGMASHPFSNVLAINTVDGRVLLWKA